MNLREARKSKGLTQIEVAKHLGVNQNTYSYWENGKTKIDNESLKKLADLFGVTVDYLLGREETKKGPAEAEPKEQPDEDDIRYALSGEIKDLTDEEFDEIMNYIKFVEQKRRKK